MTRKAILQIGTEKTGTTTLQTFLAANREALAARGFVYPRFCGALNHTGLAAYAMDADRPDSLKHPFGGIAAADTPAMRARLRAAAAEDLDGSGTAIFCSEHCHSRLVSETEVQRLRDFLAPHFDEIRVSVYLRRQDQIALSLYSTMLKSGAVPDRIIGIPDPENPYYNYDRFLGLWEKVFGQDAVSVRIFERSSLTGGSIVDDFLDQWQIGPPEAFAPVADENGSISPEAQHFLLSLNRHFGEGSTPEDWAIRGQLVASLSAGFPGKGLRPARAAAQTFYEAFRPSNAAVAARHFPDRATLFSEDFSVYPETADQIEPNPDTLARVAAALLVERGREIERLEAEIAIRDARLLGRQDRLEDAAATLARAIARAPRQPGLHRTSGEFLLRLGRNQESLAAAREACALQPDNWEYRHFLGIVLAACAEPAAAADVQREALSMKPGHPGIERALEAALSQCPPPAGATV
ncbi:hypothetical protein [Rhodovulum kholense]|uniref:Tetratricopeptide repeat protein n=1 Tax=Rhodovulum kholense TaxID=453584 RepID=A0A8E2VGQ7_9RHOB|nr:hypothetical protein [Rhodovulum kholense]PTW44161.1 hypothetical protein C8N38_11855 [Rhodovulum kholense]